MEPERLAPDYEALLAVIGDPGRGRLLDIPSGPGILARALAAKGIGEIVAVDLLPTSEFRGGDGIRYVRHDIEAPLPFPDAAFDVVVSREGIEHLIRPFGFLQEACRVLRSGGFLFLTTPNIMSVDGRIKFLLTGYFPKFRDMVNDRVGLRQQGHQAHISPIYFWQLVTLLERFGLRLETVATDNRVRHRRLPKRLLHGLLARLIRYASCRRGFDGLGVVSDAVLFGDSLIVQARKVEGEAWVSSAAVV
jgi:SAM-dependent methyltransferase